MAKLNERNYKLVNDIKRMRESLRGG